jgi:ABC-type glycerol-3-phosphate transport system substrate-binding protein
MRTRVPLLAQSGGMGQENPQGRFTMKKLVAMLLLVVGIAFAANLLAQGKAEPTTKPTTTTTTTSSAPAAPTAK